MKRKKELIVILSSLLVIVLSVSVAYFTTKILGTGKEISVESADLKVIFTSGSGTINGTNIEPGWTSGESTFTVKNESNGTYKYNIIIKDLVNTFTTSGFLVYKITSTDGGYNMTDFEDVPKSKTSKDTILAYNISIDKDATHTYTVEYKYLESTEVDQSADMGKKLSGKIFIEKYETTLISKLFENNPTISERTNFKNTFIANTTNTLYKTTEDGTDVYYFAGSDFVEAHCEYKNQQIKKSSVVNLTQSECSGEISLCEVDSDYYYGIDTTKCESVGKVIVGNVNWISSVEKPINNWVKFGEFYWRIIRTNSDGSIRLLYSGTNPDATEGYIGKIAFNTTNNSPKYVGYMYGDGDSTLDDIRANTNDSTIKTYIDNWYENNLTSYTNYLSSDAVYCNDRELASGSTYKMSNLIQNNSDTLIAYLSLDSNKSLISVESVEEPKSPFHFKSYERLDYDNQGTNANPTYNCPNKRDAFSANNTEAKLKYPIVLMTADEISYAGGVALKDSPVWYYTNSTYNSITGSDNWLLLSPSTSINSNSLVWFVHGTRAYLGSPGIVAVNATLAVRPVTSLKSCVQWKSGDGSASSPYEIVENGGC